MKKKVLLGILAGFIIIPTNVMAEETWSCNYKGSWLRTKDQKSDIFDWTVKWIKTKAGWNIIGDNKDTYGLSWFDGSCKDQKCKLTQNYKTGKLKGKSYYYSGSLTNKSIGNNQVINTLTGTWGYTTYLDGGTWKATGVCSKD